MYRQPAQSKNANDHGQGLGSVDLPLDDGPGVVHELRALKLPAGHREDLDVDRQHYEQRGQDAPEEVEIHHVAHGDHVLKQTLDKAAAFVCASIPGLRAVFGGSVLVPPQERSQSDAKGKDPEASNDSSRSSPSDQTLIPVQENIICYRQRAALCNQSPTPQLGFGPVALTPTTLRGHPRRASCLFPST